MKHRRITGIIGALSLLSLLSAPAWADSQKRSLKADLEGAQEVPVISTSGEGEFRARVNGATIEYELNYSDLEGGAVLFAHIHLGQKDVNGGIAAFLCGGGDKPACPASGTVTGTIDAADILTVVDFATGFPQGIAAGEIDELIEAMRAGNTYVNVHTGSLSPPTGFPAGEIRGQVK